MASPYAFVTLLTSDSYLPGALTLAAALKDIHPSPATPPEVDFQTVCLVTPETVDIASIKLLRKAFDLVVGVEIIEENNERGLQLLGAPSPFHVAYTSYHLPPSIPHLGTVQLESICFQFAQYAAHRDCPTCAASCAHRLHACVPQRSPPTVFFASISPPKHVPSDTRSF